MRRLILAGLLFLPGMLLIGCSRKQAEPPGPDRPLKADEAAPADVQAVARGNNTFAFDLHRKLPAAGNVFFSPFSIETALAMTYAGARGETAKEMARTLHFPFDGQRLHLGFAGLLGKLSGDDKPAGVQLSIANSLWGPYDYKESFLAVNRDCYAAHVRKVALPGAEGVINQWIAERTADRIKDILPAGTLTPDHSVLVLVNAVYFKGAWQHPFKKGATSQQEFRVKPGQSIEPMMMHQEARLKHVRLPGKGADAVQVLELPYKGGDVSMVVVLPNADDEVHEVEKGLTADKLKGWLEKAAQKKVRVALPRFKIAGDTIDLKEPLSKLGMKALFHRGADLSGIIDLPIWIDMALHKAFVEVNEEGAEAAAATVVHAKDKGKEPLPEESVEFTADHPFLFLIRDNRTGSILFLGRVSHPAS